MKKLLLILFLPFVFVFDLLGQVKPNEFPVGVPDSTDAVYHQEVAPEKITFTQLKGFIRGELDGPTGNDLIERQELIDSTGDIRSVITSNYTTLLNSINAVDAKHDSVYITGTIDDLPGLSGATQNDMAINSGIDTLFIKHNSGWLVLPFGGGGGFTNKIEDADADTKIEVEQAADEDKIRFSTRSIERLVIDSTGNVGLGIETPTDVLHVVGGLRLTGTFKDASNDVGTSTQLFSSTGTGTDWIDQSAVISGNISGLNNEQVLFGDGSGNIQQTSTFLFDGTNLGIGTTNPQSLLHIKWSGAGTIFTGIRFESDTGTSYLFGDAGGFFMRDNSSRSYVVSEGSGGFHSSAGLGSFFINHAAFTNNPIYSYFADGDTGIGRAAANTLTLWSGGEMARFDSDGDFGIGTTVPSRKVHVIDDVNGPIVSIESSLSGTALYEATNQLDTFQMGIIASSFVVQDQDGNKGQQITRTSGEFSTGLNMSNQFEIALSVKSNASNKNVIEVQANSDTDKLIEAKETSGNDAQVRINKNNSVESIVLNSDTTSIFTEGVENKGNTIMSGFSSYSTSVDTLHDTDVILANNKTVLEFSSTTGTLYLTGIPRLKAGQMYFIANRDDTDSLILIGLNNGSSANNQFGHSGDITIPARRGAWIYNSDGPDKWIVENF